MTIKFMNLFFIQVYHFGPRAINGYQIAYPVTIVIATLSFESL